MIGHQIGEFHITHDKLVNYCRTIAAISDRVTIEEYAYSHEKRPLLMLTITSPQNHQNLENIREQHVQLTDPNQSDNLDINSMPTVLWAGYNIHGNEPSGGNAAALVVYYLAAAQGIDDLLQNTVILLDPCYNPDGFHRFSTWVNMHKSIYTEVTDPAIRELNEVWPRARTNHYWFDLNRDWLPIQHPESQGRIKKFHEWKPNILTDHHEMGSNSTFFFQPGIPSRTNPNTPQENQDLTAQIGNYHAQFLDNIGSLYFTKEAFDDFYYGKGSTYPDINGGIGILFEQGSSRGHAQETIHGVLRFPFTIRNQFTTTLSTMQAALEMRTELLDYQRRFFKEGQSLVNQSKVKAYVFGDKVDQAKTYHFLDLLLQHQIEVYRLEGELNIDNQSFDSESSFVVPMNQNQYRLIKTIFEENTEFQDSLFYDVSAWTLPLAYGLPYAETSGGNLGEKITEATLPQGQIIGGQSNYSYLFEWDEYFAPKVLNQILSNGIRTKAANSPFDLSGVAYDYGTILVPVQNQKMDANELYSFLEKLAQENGLKIQAVSTGLSSSGIALGSRLFENVNLPQVMMPVGGDVRSYDAGEVWHLLDRQMNMPISLVETTLIPQIDLNRYNVITLVDGNYNFGANFIEDLKSWVEQGNTLILYKRAVDWAIKQGLTDVKFKEMPKLDSSLVYDYADRSKLLGAQRLGGVIFQAKLDLTHPLGYGYNQELISVFKNSTLFMEKSKSPFDSPLIYTDDPLQSGYISEENYELIKNSSSINVNGVGKGVIISFADNTNFRAFWRGTEKLFLNAIFFGQFINTGN